MASQANRPRDRIAQLASELVRFRRHRERLLPDGVAGEPAWDLLLILLADKDSVRYSISGLCRSACMSFTTALRWTRVLEQCRLVELTADPHHANRIYVEISDHGEALARACIEIISLE